MSSLSINKVHTGLSCFDTEIFMEHCIGRWKQQLVMIETYTPKLDISSCVGRQEVVYVLSSPCFLQTINIEFYDVRRIYGNIGGGGSH